MTKSYYFDRFFVDMPATAVSMCSHSGDCSADVKAWIPEITRDAMATPNNVRRELAEYGAWGSEELADDDANWERIVWIAAGNIRDEELS